MFDHKADVYTFIFNHGMFDFVDLDYKEELAEELYRSATDVAHADVIVEKYCA